MVRPVCTAVCLFCLATSVNGLEEGPPKAARVLRVAGLGLDGGLTAMQRDGLPRTIQAVLDGVADLRVLYVHDAAPADQASTRGQWTLVCRYREMTDEAMQIGWELRRPGGTAAWVVSGEVSVASGRYRDLICDCREAASLIVDSIAEPLGLPVAALDGPGAGRPLLPALVEAMARLDESSLISVIDASPSAKPSAAHHLAIAESYAWLSHYTRHCDGDMTYDYAARAAGHYNAAVLMDAPADRADLVLAFVLFIADHAAEADVVVREAMERGVDSPKTRCSAGLIRTDPRYAVKRAEQEPDSVIANLLAAMTLSRTGARDTAEQYFRRVQDLNHHFLHATFEYVEHASVGPARQYSTLALNRVLARDLRYLSSQDWIAATTRAEGTRRMSAASGTAGGSATGRSALSVLNRLLSGRTRQADAFELLEVYKWLAEQAQQEVPSVSRTRFSGGDYLAFSRAQVFEALWARHDVLAYRLGVSDHSKQFADAFVGVFPQQALTNCLVGLWHSRYGKWQDARPHYLRALSLKPSVWLKIMLTRRTSRTRSETTIRSIGPEFPHSPRLITSYIKASDKGQGRDLAAKWFKRSLDLDPFVVSAYEQLAKLTGEPEHLDRAVALVPQSSAAHLAAARMHASNSPDRAIEYYRKCIELSARESAAYSGLGAILSSRGQYEEAVREYERYLEIDSSSLRAVHMMNRIGSIYFKMDRLDEALAVFERAATSWQQGSMLGLAGTYERLGRYEEAEDWFRKQAGRYSSGPTYLFKFYARQGRIAEAEEILRRQAKKSLSLSFRRAAAGMYIRHGLPERLIELYAEVYPRRDPLRYAHDGAANLAMGKADEAVRHLQRGFEASGWNHFAFVLCSALIDTGDIAGAIQAVRTSNENASQRERRTVGEAKAYQFLLGDVGEKEFMAEAGRTIDEGLVYYCLALRARASGDTESAKSLLLRCLACTDHPLKLECALAKARLRLMGCGDVEQQVEAVRSSGREPFDVTGAAQRDREWQDLIRAHTQSAAEKAAKEAETAFERAMGLDGVATATDKEKLEAWRQYLSRFEKSGYKVAKARERMAHWLGRAVGEKLSGSIGEKLKRNVTLQKPYPRPKLSLQYAVIELLRQVGVRYNFRASRTSAGRACGRWVHPDVKEIPCYLALDELLDPLGLTYELVDGQVVLARK